MESLDGVHPGERLVVWKAPAAAARYLRISATGSPLEVQTAGQTIGHAATAKCICVASSDATLAAPVFTPASRTEDSSSDGPHHMFYHPDGTPVTPGNFLASGGVLLQTPALTAGDGGATSVPGFAHFYGTSAAAPAAAAIAALVWSRAPALTNTQVRTILETSCLDIEAPGFEVNSGNGLLMADLALKKTLKPQDEWRKLHFGTYSALDDAAPGADPDRDGLPNLVEYATGTDPKAANLSPLTTLSRSGATFTLNYRHDPAATDAVISFEHATGLSGWQAVTPSSDTLLSTAGGIELRGATLATGTGGRDFFRMVVTAP
jgi:subtilisin family serine protease